MKNLLRTDAELLDDMIGFCCDMMEFTKMETFESFYSKKMCYMACLHSFTLLGEAATKLSKKTKLENPDIPWRIMSDMRNFLVHWYHGVELRIPWEAVQNNIPLLLEDLRKIKL